VDVTQPPRTRVLFVIYGLAAAGPERRILDFARSFPDRPEPLDVHICVVGDDMTLFDEFRQTGAGMLCVPMRRPYTDWRGLHTVFDYIEQHDIRVLNSFDLKTLLVCAAAKVRYGSRVKLVHHLISLWEDVPAPHRAILRTAMRCADQILCNGHAVKAHLIGDRRLAAPVSVIPNGVDVDYFQPMPEARAAERARQGWTDDHFVLGTVGNVRPVKNYPFLLRAMARLVPECPDARLLCVGGGAQLEDMRALARSLGIENQVVFTGLAKDVRPYLAAMDAFALCSTQEGNPNVVLQAMATAVPVVSVRVGEVPCVIQDGTSGLLVDRGDESAFVTALMTLAADRCLCQSMGAAGRRRVTDLYSSARMIAGYAALMQQAAAA